MDGKVTYHQQVSYCGKPHCRKCQEGIGHGPYWYAYQTINGRTTRKYIGKSLPSEVQAMLEMEATPSTEIVPSSSHVDLNTMLVRIFTLGRFQIERRVEQHWQVVTDASWLRRSRVRALLALLLCSPGRSVERATVMELLWPKKDKETTAGNLNIALQCLRKILRNPREPQLQGMLLRSEGDTLILADQRVVWVDADVFTSLVDQVSVPNYDDAVLQFPPEDPLSSPAAVGADSARIKGLREALAIYGGDFIPEGQRVTWVKERAQELRRLWVAILLDLADLYMVTDTTAAIDILNRLLAYDPSLEAAVHRLIVVLVRLKRRGEALRVYHRFVETLRLEYAKSPSQETLSLYEAIRLGEDQISVLSTTAFALTASAPLAKAPVALAVEDTRTLLIGRSNQTPLVGRDRELEVLRALLLEAKSESRMQVLSQRRSSGIPLDTQRRPQCVVLLGETGIGKTRLAEEISREARRGGWAVVWSRVYAQESGVPYRLWTEVLRNLRNGVFGFVSAFYEHSLSEGKILSGSGLASSLEAFQPLVTLLPEFSEFLPGGNLQPGKQFTPEQEQLRLWEAVRDLLMLVSESIPLLIVLDDVQWADASSCELLGYLARSLYGFPVSFVVTCRETELPTRPPHPLRSLIDHMLREHSVTTLNIEPLSGEQIGQLVSGISQLSESMVQYIQENASGNPFFAEEMARTTPPILPKTVSAALEHRIHRLSEPCQRLLGSAAVLGGSFEFPFICAMEAKASLSDEDMILTLLEEALQAGVLTEEGIGTRITYRFWHPLLVSYLYEDISATRRVRLHRRVAEVLQQTYRHREEEVAATITHHLVRGDAEVKHIAHYAELAANRAYTLSANAEAVQYYWLAAECLGLVTRDEQTEGTSFVPRALPDRLDDDVYAHHICLLERLAECDMVRGNFADARQLYELLLKWREKRPVDDARYEAQIRALLWGEIGRTWRYAVNSNLAWQCCERGEKILLDTQATSSPAWKRLRLFRCNLYLQEGRFNEVNRVASEVLALFEQQAQPPSSEQQPRVQRSGCTTRIQRILQGDPADLGFVHRILGDIAIREGQLSVGFTHLNTALALYEQYGYKREIAHVSCNLGYIHMKRAKYELAQAAFRRAFSLAESIDDDPLISVILSDRGEMAMAQGHFQEAEYWYKKAMVLLERTQDREYASRWNAALSLVLQESGKEAEAIACAVRALVIGRTIHTNPCIGTALVSMGLLRLMQARNADLSPEKRIHILLHGRQNIQRALALDGLEAETHTLGQLGLAQTSLLLQETRQARRQLKQVIESAQRYELALVEHKARTLLAELR